MDDPSVLRNEARALRTQAEAATAEAEQARSEITTAEAEAVIIDDAFERLRLANKVANLRHQADSKSSEAAELGRRADEQDALADRRAMEMQEEARDLDKQASAVAETEGDDYKAQDLSRQADDIRRRAA